MSAIERCRRFLRAIDHVLAACTGAPGPLVPVPVPVTRGVAR